MNKMREYERGRGRWTRSCSQDSKTGGVEGLEEEKLKRQKIASLDR